MSKKLIRVFALMTALMMVLAGCGKKSADSNAATESVATESVTAVSAAVQTGSTVAATALQFPYEAEGGKLIIKSVFQSSMENPDCGNQYGDNVASIEVYNNSEECLVNGEILIYMTDGTPILFNIAFLPAGQSILAFASDNASISNTDCAAVTTNCSFDVAVGDYVNNYSVSVEGTQVTVTNISDSEMSDISVFCHCSLGDSLLGGTVYQYGIEYLGSGESATIDCPECILGEASVCYIN